MIRKHIEIMDQYDPQKRIDLLVDEWGTWFDVEPGTNDEEVQGQRQDHRQPSCQISGDSGRKVANLNL